MADKVHSYMPIRRLDTMHSAPMDPADGGSCKISKDTVPIDTPSEFDRYMSHMASERAAADLREREERMESRREFLDILKNEIKEWWIGFLAIFDSMRK